MARFLAWPESAFSPELVRTVLDALDRGSLIGLPTDTTFAIAAGGHRPDAIDRLIALQENNPAAVVLASTRKLPEGVHGLGLMGRRLARKSWPGGLTLTKRPAPESNLSIPSNRQLDLAFRMPDHMLALDLLDQAAWPIVISLENGVGYRSAGDIAGQLNDQLEFIIDDGRVYEGKPTSLVEVNDRTWTLRREGAVAANVIQANAARQILFVCTGNTCRSPLAAALCQRMLAQKLACQETELVQKGFVVLSAGLAAMMGESAAPEAIESARIRGGNLEKHLSQPVTVDLLNKADHIVVMTNRQLAVLSELEIHSDCRLRLLAAHAEDIADPLGGDSAVYEQCANQIWDNLALFLDEIIEEG